jgi:hypothetical protein
MTGKQVIVNGVHVSGRAWFKLATLAEKRGLTVAEVVAGGIEAMITPDRSEASKFGRTTTPLDRRKMTPRRMSRCRELYALGYPDYVIAQGVGLATDAITTWREKEQLPAQPRLSADYPRKVRTTA